VPVIGLPTSQNEAPPRLEPRIDLFVCLLWRDDIFVGSAERSDSPAFRRKRREIPLFVAGVGGRRHGAPFELQRRYMLRAHSLGNRRRATTSVSARPFGPALVPAWTRFVVALATERLVAFSRLPLTSPLRL
jgi:hypothetical protein